MTAIDLDWLCGWAAAHGLEAAVDRLLTLSYVADVSEHMVIPLENARASTFSSLAHGLANLLHDDGRRILWVRQTGIWGDETENMGTEAVRSLMIAHGGDPESRGAIFEAGESVILAVFLLVILEIGWDAYLLAESGAYACLVSHDQYIEIAAGKGESLAEVTENVSGWKHYQTTRATLGGPHRTADSA